MTRELVPLLFALVVLCLLPSIGGLITAFAGSSKCRKCKEYFPSIETKCFHRVYICREKECPK